MELRYPANTARSGNEMTTTWLCEICFSSDILRNHEIYS